MKITLTNDDGTIQDFVPVVVPEVLPETAPIETVRDAEVVPEVSPETPLADNTN